MVKRKLPKGRPKYEIDAVRRGLGLLRAFGQDRPTLSLVELANAADVTSSTALRFAKTLVDRGYLEEDSIQGSYRPGIRAVAIGNAALTTSPMHMVALEPLRELHRRLSETVNLSVMVGSAVCHIERLKRADLLPTRVGIGSLFPAYATAPGKVLLATQPPDARKALIDAQDLQPITVRTITMAKDLRSAIRDAGRSGYAVADGELLVDLRAIAVPVRTALNIEAAALGMTAPAQRYEIKELRTRMLPELLTAAQEIAAALDRYDDRARPISAAERTSIEERPDGASRYHVAALSRALAVMTAIERNGGPMLLKDIALAIGAKMPTAFRVATTLVGQGVLSQSRVDGSYRVAYQSLGLGYCALVNLEAPELARPYLERLRKASGESVFLSILAGASIVSITRLLRPERLSIVGHQFPAHLTPDGKVLLAFCDLDGSSLAASRANSPGGPNVLSIHALESQLQAVRRERYAVTDEELAPGTRGVAAPIFDATGQCIAAISIVSAANRQSAAAMRERFAPMVRQTAAQINELLSLFYATPPQGRG